MITLLFTAIPWRLLQRFTVKVLYSNCACSLRGTSFMKDIRKIKFKSKPKIRKKTCFYLVCFYLIPLFDVPNIEQRVGRGKVPSAVNFRFRFCEVCRLRVFLVWQFDDHFMATFWFLTQPCYSAVSKLYWRLKTACLLNLLIVCVTRGPKQEAESFATYRLDILVFT